MGGSRKTHKRAHRSSMITYPKKQLREPRLVAERGKRVVERIQSGS
jgi:hypothetical protein